jgi:hypothetical protein
MKAQRVTVLFLSLAALWSAALTISVFVIHIPVRAGSHDLVQSASSGSVEAKVLPQTYFQAYGVPEVLLAGMGIVMAALVAYLLYRRGTQTPPNAGRAAWGISVGTLVVGIVGFVTIAPYLLFVGIFLMLACRSFSRQSTSAMTGPPSIPATLRTSH